MYVIVMRHGNGYDHRRAILHTGGTRQVRPEMSNVKGVDTKRVSPV